jgi:hypothetical protein
MFRPKAEQHVDQAEDDHGQDVFVGKKREHNGNHDQQWHNPAQPRFVIGWQHVHTRTAGLKALKDPQAFGRLQKQAQDKPPHHHNRHQPANTRWLQVKAIAVEHNAHDRPEHNQ